MSAKTSLATLGLLAALTGITLAPAARASVLDKETIVGFPMPVEVPGRVLSPGTYVFKIANNGELQNIVQIFSEDQVRRRRLVATEMTLPTEQVRPADKATFFLRERPSGNPDALGVWLYPGLSEGYEFVYPKPAKGASANVTSTISSRPLDSAFGPYVCTNSDSSRDLDFRLCYEQAEGAMRAGH